MRAKAFHRLLPVSLYRLKDEPWKVYLFFRPLSMRFLSEIITFLSNQKKYMKVEVQFRTIAMDFWASLDHKLKYKKEINNPEEVVARLKLCADNLAAMDQEMESIRQSIDQEYL